VRLQSSQANCGSTSLYNAAHALGRTAVSLEECERACKVSATDGTSPKRLMMGVRELGLRVLLEIREARADIAAMQLERQIRSGHPVALVVDCDSHWAAVVGRLGDRYLVADSADSELVLSLSEGELLQRWANPEARRGFYGVVIGV
jgi:hypothetical protein